MDRNESIRKFRALEVMDLIFRINGTTPTRDHENKVSVFLTFGGHIGRIRIQIYADGWSALCDPDIEMEGALEDDKDMEVIITTLLEVLAQKEKLL